MFGITILFNLRHTLCCSRKHICFIMLKRLIANKSALRNCVTLWACKNILWFYITYIKCIANKITNYFLMFQVCWAIETTTPNVPLMNFNDSINADPTSSLEAQLYFGERCDHVSSKVVIQVGLSYTC